MSFQKDLNPNPSHSNSTLRHLNIRSTPMKLIYIISSIYNQKSSVLITFCLSIKRRKMDSKSSVLVKSMFLDIQILDPAIWLWSKHLKTPTN